MVEESEDFFKISTSSSAIGVEFYLDETEEEIDAVVISGDVPIPDTGERVDLVTLHSEEGEDEFNETQIEKSYVVDSKKYEYAKAPMDVNNQGGDERLISVVKVFVHEVEE